MCGQDKLDRMSQHKLMKQCKVADASVRLRLVFAHDGTSTYDRLFLRQFVSRFETYIVTFVSPTQVPVGVHTVLLQDFGTQLRIQKLNGLRIAIGTLWRIFQFRRCLEEIRPDIVVGNWVTKYGLYASFSKCKPFVLFVYGSDVLIEPYRSFLHRWLATRVIRSADLILVDSEVQKKAVLSLGASARKIESFPWIDLSELRNLSPDSALRDALGWHDKIVVVSVRWHEDYYAIDTLIRSIPMVVAKAPDVRFLLFGKGTHTVRLMELAHQLKVERFVHFAGVVTRNQLLRYVKSCDIYVSTALSDGSSSSLLEAMFIGVPVVVTLIPGNAEWVFQGINGQMFGKRDSDGLGRAVVYLAANRDEARLMGQRGRQTIQERVNWKISSDKLFKRMCEIFAKTKGQPEMGNLVDLPLRSEVRICSS